MNAMQIISSVLFYFRRPSGTSCKKYLTHGISTKDNIWTVEYGTHFHFGFLLGKVASKAKMRIQAMMDVVQPCACYSVVPSWMCAMALLDGNRPDYSNFEVKFVAAITRQLKWRSHHFDRGTSSALSHKETRLANSRLCR